MSLIWTRMSTFRCKYVDNVQIKLYIRCCTCTRCNYAKCRLVNSRELQRGRDVVRIFRVICTNSSSFSCFSLQLVCHSNVKMLWRVKDRYSYVVTWRNVIPDNWVRRLQTTFGALCLWTHPECRFRLDSISVEFNVKQDVLTTIL